jgi:hypothetical protein
VWQNFKKQVIKNKQPYNYFPKNLLLFKWGIIFGRANVQHHAEVFHTKEKMDRYACHVCMLREICRKKF